MLPDTDYLTIPRKYVQNWWLLTLHQNTHAGKLKLTVTGNLPVKVCKLLFDRQLIKWQYMEYVVRMWEAEILFIWPLKEYLIGEGIVKKRNNALSLTKNGEKLMQEAAPVRFQRLLQFFTRCFHWGNFYRIDDGGKAGQLGWAYSLLLLLRHGEQAHESNFYSLKHMQAFEPELYRKRHNKEHTEETRRYHIAYDVRFFERFADWFGLVIIERRRNLEISIHDQLMIRKTELADLLFREVK